MFLPHGILKSADHPLPHPGNSTSVNVASSSTLIPSTVKIEDPRCTHSSDPCRLGGVGCESREGARQGRVRGAPKLVL